jgi:hypothetical protein
MDDRCLDEKAIKDWKDYWEYKVEIIGHDVDFSIVVDGKRILHNLDGSTWFGHQVVDGRVITCADNSEYKFDNTVTIEDLGYYHPYTSGLYDELTKIFSDDIRRLIICMLKPFEDPAICSLEMACILSHYSRICGREVEIHSLYQPILFIASTPNIYGLRWIDGKETIITKNGAKEHRVTTYPNGSRYEVHREKDIIHNWDGPAENNNGVLCYYLFGYSITKAQHNALVHGRPVRAQIDQFQHIILGDNFLLGARMDLEPKKRGLLTATPQDLLFNGVPVIRLML